MRIPVAFTIPLPIYTVRWFPRLLSSATPSVRLEEMSGGKGKGKETGGRKGSPFVWEGTLGPDFFGEPVYELPVEEKSEFTKDAPLRLYDQRKEPWPKCMHGEDCVVQMMTEGVDGGRRFYKCPRAWSSEAEENCGFARWVDPPAIHPYNTYIYWLQDRLFDLREELSSALQVHDDVDENSNDAGSQEPICTDPYCNCPHHKNKGPPPPPPPPPPPTMGGYCGEGSTQFAMWDRY